MMGRFRDGMTQVTGRNLKGNKATVTFDWTSTEGLFLRIDWGATRGSTARLEPAAARRLASALRRGARWREEHLAELKRRTRRTGRGST